jgi:hypothetical protein
MSIHEAIEDFRQAAIRKAGFASPASRDDALHRRMSSAYKFIISQGMDGRAEFIRLLHDNSPHVRAWVAAQLLSDGDEVAIPVLEQLAVAPGISGFVAATTLKRFRAGKLNSPFTSHDA